MGEPTVLSIEQYGKKVTYELPYSDTTLDELIQGFIGCLVTLTWNENIVLEGLKDYAEERLPDEEC